MFGKHGGQNDRDSPAVEVQQNASPARHDDAIVPSPPAMGRESKRPMVVKVKLNVVLPAVPLKR